MRVTTIADAWNILPFRGATKQRGKLDFTDASQTTGGFEAVASGKERALACFGK